MPSAAVASSHLKATDLIAGRAATTKVLECGFFCTFCALITPNRPSSGGKGVERWRNRSCPRSGSCSSASPPKGWALCNGQFLPINQNQALFSLLGTTYGGNGQTNFALPDLRGRVPIHVGSGHTLGERGGEQAHTLSIAELPHAHARAASASTTTAATQPGAGNVLWPSNAPTRSTRPPATWSRCNPTSVTNVGGSQAHLNMQPFLTLNFCIALQGIFPSPELRRRSWHNPTSARSGCSRATSRPPDGCSARGSSCRSRENETLFKLIGTTYGGDGESTFALPDLRGRVPIHQGNGFILAETGGAEEVTLTVNQIPAHTHPLAGLDETWPRTRVPGNHVPAQIGTPGACLSCSDAPTQNMAPQAITPVGGSQPHTNLQPYLCINFIISLFGSSRPPETLRSETRDMADPFVAEIRIFPFNFAPKGWAFCDGQLLPLSQNTALFSLLGTTYGGDGKSNFALPDLQGSAPMHPGQGPGLVPARPGRDRRLGDGDAARVGDPRPHPRHSCGHRVELGELNAPAPTTRWRASATASACTAPRRQAGPDGARGAAARRRRPAAQQHDAVPDAQLLHRPARGLPAAGLRVGRGRR